MKIGDEAMTLAHEQGLDFHDPAMCAWALLVDAARTFAALPPAGPRGLAQSSWPDFYRAKWENFAVERERITDNVDVQTTARFTPSPREIDRAEEVMVQWHPQHFRGVVQHPDRAVKACWLHAGGSPTRRVAKILRCQQPNISRWKAKLSLIVGRRILPNLEGLRKSA